ncbi:hypothetical protein GALMADRAFT_1201748 [Galerina marginata CBS 339.88]|uniref:G domain-containing protein n=1 Tax=Galerina marginata (strain CBS 339.88) TaxID=685588 RepID=A0A067TBB7_GALM3|nr:hypothetical protein GALMADRAFT_1201748 [Galerina marginata CBS 339.88]
MSPTPNIVLFGESGCGKSSIVNMIAGRELAAVSSSVNGCTFTSARYEVDIQGTLFNVYDTAGLDEGDNGTVPKQAATVQLFRLLKTLDTGINLLVFCVRGKIKPGTHKNWRLFHEIICRRQVPIVLAITGLEDEENMDEFWVRNKEAFQKYRMYPQGVGCITATRGRRLKSGVHRLDEEYEESKVKMWNLLKTQFLEQPWKVQPVEWFKDIINVTYESECLGLWHTEHREVVTVAGSAIQELVDRCEMTEAEAKKLGEALSRV